MGQITNQILYFIKKISCKIIQLILEQGPTHCYDYNNDGKLDIICGNYGTYDTTGQQIGSIAILENTGTVSQPKFDVVNEDFASIVIKESTDKKPLLLASFNGKSVELNDLNLIKVFFKYPLMTLKVIFGIHFHALFLYLKKVKFEPHPKNKVDDISFSD